MKARVVAHQCPLAAPEMRALFIKNKAIALGAGRSPAPKKIAVCEQKGLATNGTTDSANCAHVSRIRIAALRHEERGRLPTSCRTDPPTAVPACISSKCAGGKITDIDANEDSQAVADSLRAAYGFEEASGAPIVS